MGDDSCQLPLERRVPGATGASSASYARPELPEALLQRMQAVVNAAHAQAVAKREPEPGAPAAGSSDGDAGADTAPLPRLTASGAPASQLTDHVELQPGCAARPGQEPAAEPAEREQAEEADRRLVSQTERLTAVEAERRAEAQRGAQAERERAEQAERERVEQAEREQAEEAERSPRRAAQLQRIRAEQAAFAREREQAQRQEAERAVQRGLARQPRKSTEADSPAEPSATPPVPEQASAVARTPADRPEPRSRPSIRKAPVRHRARTGALVTAAAVLLAAGWLALEHPSHNTTNTSAHFRGVTGTGISQVIRNQAAAWVAHQVGRTDIVSCDPSMCQALKTHGIPAHDLLMLEPKGTDLFGSTVVVATATVRNQFGSRLDSVYAPGVLASFGSGKARIDIRQTAPRGPAAYWSALKADQQERKAVEPTLAESLQIVATAAIRRALRAGRVDSRLYLLIEGMATQLTQPIQIMAWGDLSPRASPGIPFRSATLVGSTANLRKLLTFAQSLNILLAPNLSKIMRLDGQPALLVAFAAPSPLEVFSHLGS